MTTPPLSFDRYGRDAPASPVVLSVPHAGRDYPAALRADIRVPLAALAVLEDRHVDAVAMAARREETILVQRIARAWIDLNRGEWERDPKLDSGADATRQPMASAKLRSGLGLVPRRIAGVGDIWRRRLTGDEVQARITVDHRPYHAALADALARARARFGIAILIDVHSMPPLGAPGDVAQLVFGDRFGKTSAARFVARMEAVADAAGIQHALNTPYSGGHILDRHADPASGIHGIQIELDRSLYLDAMLDRPGPGSVSVAALLRRIVDAVADEALSGGIALAAE